MASTQQKALSCVPCGVSSCRNQHSCPARAPEGTYGHPGLGLQGVLSFLPVFDGSSEHTCGSCAQGELLCGGDRGWGR